MNNFNNILLASHGTIGSEAAVSYVLTLCQAGASLHHLIVVPEFWKGMMGDDWLNNGVSRDRFARYLESELGRETDQHIQSVREQAESANIQYHHVIQVGEPYACVIAASTEQTFDLVVIGSKRPKGTPGLNSRMALDKLSGQLNTPLLIVPYPTQ
jgi:nucleotide-binding universal stress UspA family protein